MKSLFEESTHTEIQQRIDALNSSLQPLWGKMDVAQMCTHLRKAFEYPISNKSARRMLIGYIIGWAFKPMMVSEKPWKKNMPTANVLKITDQRAFDTERQQLKAHIEKFYTMGPGNAGKFPHPMFGELTPEQWGKSMYKHVDHHLQQFGV